MKQFEEFFQLFALLILAAVLIYFVPVSLNRLLFLLVLPLAWKSKKDYFWLAFLIVMLDYPGGLFHGGEREDMFRLPIYSFGPGLGFAIQELFFIVIFLKAWIRKEKSTNKVMIFYGKELKALFILWIVLVAVSPLFGMSSASYRNVYKMAIALTLFYSTIRLISTKEQLTAFLRLIFPFAFVGILLIIYSLINKQQIIALVKPGVLNTQGYFNRAGLTGVWERPIELVHTLFICFTGSLFLLSCPKNNFKRGYLVVVNLLSFIAIFLSATRSWFLAFVAGYFLFYLFNIKRFKRYIGPVMLIALIALYFVVTVMPVLRRQITNAWGRLSTIENLFEGDLTAGGTASRYDVRAPRVMEGFASSSIMLGAAYSDRFYEYADGHVGYHNILLNTGIFGSLLFFIVIFRIMTFPFKMGRKYAVFNKPHIKVSTIAIVMLLILNFGTQTVGFTPDGINRVFLMAFAVLLVEIAMRAEWKDYLILKEKSKKLQGQGGNLINES